MTRAKDELVLTSAADYGSGRPRKVSRFVVEALDLPSPAPVPRKSQAQEALRRHQPAPEPLPGPGGAARATTRPCSLSYRQVDDYETCPLKYRYVHVLRVPLLTHHGLVYGHAVHEAVRAHVRGAPRGSALHGRRPGGRLQARRGSRKASCRAPTKSSVSLPGRPRCGASTRRRRSRPGLRARSSRSSCSTRDATR